jgi:tetratricopeptide (TPR) repeat protein
MNPNPTVTFVDLYQLLGVAPTATAQEIEQAVRLRRRKVRRQTGSPTLEKRQQAEKLMAQLAEAQRTLLDPAARAEYDRRHAEHQAAPRQATEAPPTDADGLLRDIRVALDGADYRTAGTLTAQAIRTLDSGESWSLHAEMLDAINQFQQAAEAARKAVDRDPGNPQYSYQLGLELEASGSAKLALDAYRGVDRLAPDSPLGRTGIARLLLQTDQVDEALSVLRPLHERFPDHTLVAELYAMALACAAEKVPRERYNDGGIYITSADEIQRMEKLLREALGLKIEDPQLRRELRALLEEVEDTGRYTFTLRIFPGLRASFAGWWMALVLLAIGLAAGGLWLLAALAYCTFIGWRAYAPRWRHNRRREGERIEQRVQQRRVQELMDELGRL